MEPSNEGFCGMKILIATDMEGVSGVVNWDQVRPGHTEYPRFRKLMTEDVNAAVRGALEAGADQILVVDGHWAGANILVEELDPRARLISGSPSPLSMMQGVDETVDGVFFVGYHARNGSANAILDHTWSSLSVANVWLNNVLTGEYGLNAAVAGHYGVPVIMVSGDQTACAETIALLGDLETAVVKQAVGRYSADCLSPRSAQETIFAAASKAVERLIHKKAPGPYVVHLPVEIRIEFFASHMADNVALVPGIRREGVHVSFNSEDMIAAYSTFRSVVNLSMIG
jgi:D-amino peptidase